MPIIGSFIHTLVASDNGTRVRVDSPSSTAPIVVEVGDTNETWVEGAFIEVVRLPNCQAPVSLVASPGATIVEMSGTSSLELGEYTRVSKVNGQANTWDLHIYELASAPGYDRLAVVDNNSTLVHDEPSEGVFTDVSLMTFGNGLRVRDAADRGGTAGKFVIVTPAIRTSVYTFNNAPAATFRMRSTIADMVYWGTYSSVGSPSLPYDGTFDTSLVALNANFSDVYTVLYDPITPQTSVGNVSINSGAAHFFWEFEIMATVSPPNYLQVGYFTQAYGPPLNLEESYGGPFSSWYRSNGTISFPGNTITSSQGGYGIGDVIGVYYAPNTARVGFYKNGLFCGEVGAINSGGVAMCGAVLL